jgi:hypothetical protein
MAKFRQTGTKSQNFIDFFQVKRYITLLSEVSQPKTKFTAFYRHISQPFKPKEIYLASIQTKMISENF